MKRGQKAKVIQLRPKLDKVKDTKGAIDVLASAGMEELDALRLLNNAQRQAAGLESMPPPNEQ
jgi:hypothetical protein